MHGWKCFGGRFGGMRLLIESYLPACMMANIELPTLAIHGRRAPSLDGGIRCIIPPGQIHIQSGASAMHTCQHRNRAMGSSCLDLR